MKLKIIVLLVFILFLGQSVAASDSREIMLIDGSVISGEILAFDGSIYTIESGSLGTVKIDSSEIKVIQTPSRANRLNQQSGILQGDLLSLQQTLIQNADVMRLIESAQTDPQIKAILNDQQIMQSIMAGDIQALMNNPKFTALMNNPTINRIKEQVISQ